MTPPVWISEVIHDDQIDRFGGSHGIRDENLFLASLDRPRNLLAYGDSPTLFDLAAAYAYGIAKNHPFVDGNKRTGFVLAAVFLELNGYLLDAPNSEVVEIVERLFNTMVIAVADCELNGETIIGRNILNRYVINLDGRNRIFTIS